MKHKLGLDSILEDEVKATDCFRYLEAISPFILKVSSVLDANTRDIYVLEGARQVNTILYVVRDISNTIC